jgi:hypothetical protein
MDPIKEDIEKMKIVSNDSNIEQHDCALAKLSDEQGPEDGSLAQTNLRLADKVDLPDAISFDWRSMIFGLTDLSIVLCQTFSPL